MRSEQEVNSAIERYAGTVRRLCTVYLKNDADTEDIFQTVFLKYVLSSVSFENEEQEKYRRFVPASEAERGEGRKILLSKNFRSRREVLEAVLSLPRRCRDIVYLHYYEGYTAPEIGRMLGRNVNTVYTLLTRSKKLLREKLGGDEYEW